MKRSNFFIFIAIVILIGYIKLGEEKPGQPQQQSAATPEPKVLTANDSYALRVTDNQWPSLAGEQSDVAGDRVTRNYYLVFDGSGSMENSDCSRGQAKIDVAKTALKQFIQKIDADANIGLLVFDKQGIRERAALGHSSKQQLIEQIDRVTPAGGTPLRDSIRLAYQSLTRQAVKQLGYGEYHLVVVTDGLASDGQGPAGIVRQLTRESPVVLHTVGFCIGSNHSLNQSGITLYKSANNPEDLASGLDAVLAEASDFSVDSFDSQE